MNDQLITPHRDYFRVVRGFESIRPIYERLGERGYIAGSYAAFMAAPCDHPILPNDIDIFATSQENASALTDDLIKLPQVLWMEENDTAFTITRGTINCHDLAIQIVKPNPAWQIFPEDILNDFDLDISRAVLVGPNKVIADYNVGLHEGKVLRVNNPLRSLKRVLKYHARGVEFNDHELLKLFQAWEQMSEERKAIMLDRARMDAAPYEPANSGDWEYDEDDWFEGE